MEIIRLELTLSMGEDKLDDDPRNPISRAYSALLAQGRAHKAHTLCFLNPGNSSNAPLDNPRWLGVFVHSAGDRILFFPALSAPIDWLETRSRGTSAAKRSIALDHISAEPDRLRWHFTGVGSEDHISGGRTPSDGRGSYYWFGLSIQSENSLMPTRRHTIITHESPAADIERRFTELRSLEDSASYAYVGSDTGHVAPFQPNFLHFCFLFSERSAPNYSGPEWLAPAGSPYISPPLPAEVPDTRIRLHRIPLSADWDVQIATILLPGTINVPATFTGPGSL
jgi:hypothetical protein